MTSSDIVPCPHRSAFEKSPRGLFVQHPAVLIVIAGDALAAAAV